MVMKRVAVITAICFALFLTSCGYQPRIIEESQAPKTSGYLSQSSGVTNDRSDEPQGEPDAASGQIQAEAVRSPDESLAPMESFPAYFIGSTARPKEIAVHVTGLTWNKSSDLTLSVGDSNRRTATTTPAGGAVTYTSSEAAVASVDAAGNVTCKAAGKAVITAVSGGASVSYNLTVVAAASASGSTASVSGPSATASGSAGSSNGTGVFSGHTVTVADKTTLATTASGDAKFVTYTFLSSSGKALGNISGKAQQNIVEKYHITSSTGEWVAPGNGGNWEEWFAEQFNLYRGLRGGNADGASESGNRIDVASLESELLRLTNEARSKEGLNELTSNASLNDLARTRAEETASNYSHTRPDGSTVADLGYGENFVKGRNTASAAFDTWMDSSGHKANILRDGIAAIGIGVYQVPNGDVYCIQLFAY